MCFAKAHRLPKQDSFCCFFFFFFIKLLFLLEGEGVLGVYCKTQKLHVVINIAPLYISDKIVVCNIFSFVDLVRELLKQILLDLVYINPIRCFCKVKMNR